MTGVQTCALPIYGRRIAYRAVATDDRPTLILASAPLEDARKAALFWLAGLYGLLAVGLLTTGCVGATDLVRALANDPPLLLADEPSGNLDNQTAAGLHELFFRLRDERELAVVLVTHNRELARRADRVLWLQDGHLNPVSLSLAEQEVIP